MQRLRIYYFSGTGNARRVALWMAEEARRLGADARACSIDFGVRAEPPLPGEKLGFVFPVHGFTTISALLRFVAAFPRGDGSQAVFAASVTGGVRIGRLTLPGWEGSGLYLPLFLLRLKGYRCAGALPFRRTPENWTALVPSCSEPACRSLMSETHPAAAAFVAAVLSGKAVFRGRLSLLFGLAALPVSLVYILFARYFLAKLFFATARCNACGLCAEGCPLGAIRMRGGRPFWTFRCESCMRCMNFCPRQAIQTSPLLVLLLFLPGSGILERWLGGVLLQELAFSAFAAEWVAWIVGLTVKLGLLAGIYRLWFVLLRWKPANLLFEWTTPTRWYRRYREPETRWPDVAGRPPDSVPPPKCDTPSV